MRDQSSTATIEDRIQSYARAAKTWGSHATTQNTNGVECGHTGCPQRPRPTHARFGGTLLRRVTRGVRPQTGRGEKTPLAKMRLIDLLHLGALVAVLLEGRQLLDIVRLIVVLNREAELDHAVDAAPM